MYRQVTRIQPALGKGLEVRGMLADWVREDQARKKRRVGLGQRIFSSEGATLIVTRLAESLDELESIRKESLADADFQTRAAALAPNLGEPVKTAVFESIVLAPPPSSARTVASYASIYPAPGKERRIVGILEEFVKGAHADGVTMGLWRRIYSSDGPVLQIVGRYADVADMDRVRRERQTAVREAVTAVAELSRAPIAQRITETVVPIPS